jgi:hypothetical protein
MGALGKWASVQELREGKELAGLVSTSRAIVPISYVKSRGILVPFWECGRGLEQAILATRQNQAQVACPANNFSDDIRTFHFRCLERGVGSTSKHATASMLPGAHNSIHRQPVQLPLWMWGGPVWMFRIPTLAALDCWMAFLYHKWRSRRTQTATVNS